MDLDPFSVRDVSDWEVDHAEALGRDQKLWLREPGSDPKSRSGTWLFKPVVVPQHGTPQGEDWAEKLVGEIGPLLGVPCADVELAQRDGFSGSLSRNVIADKCDRVLGSELVGTVVSDYKEGLLRVPGRPGHSPQMIIKALQVNQCLPTPGHEELSAPEIFAGFLVLDAWVGNQDRHDQNWAAMRSASGALRLAPSYDHASSLGFSLLDSARDRHLRPGELAKWANKGRAHRFEHDPLRPPSEVPTLVQVAHLGLRLASDRASEYWRSRLEAVDHAAVVHLVARVTKLTPLTRRFIVELLEANRGRLLDDD